MITKVFWTVVALDGISAVVLWKVFERGSHGMGEGLVVAAYLFVVAMILVTACIFLLLRSDGWRTAMLILLLLPSAALVYSTVAAPVSRVQEERQFSGSVLSGTGAGTGAGDGEA